MERENYLKIGQPYMKWMANVARQDLEFINERAEESSRKVGLYKSTVRDLLDCLLFKCYGYSLASQGVEVTEEDEFNSEGFTVTVDRGLYKVEVNLDAFTKILRINRRVSTWDDVKCTRGVTLDFDYLTRLFECLVKISTIRYQSTENDETEAGACAVISRAYIKSSTGQVYFELNKDIVDTIVPNNKYRTKYLTDGFVLGSEYCKNFHTFVSYHANVFAQQRWNQISVYKYTPIEKLAEALGLRYNPKLRDYDKHTKQYARTNITYFIKGYVKEINEKTRLPLQFGKLNYEIIKETEGNRKVKGFRFYFEEV